MIKPIIYSDIRNRTHLSIYANWVQFVRRKIYLSNAQIGAITSACQIYDLKLSQV